jgi:RimJ/RimL family protein N-acetyltransferase
MTAYLGNTVQKQYSNSPVLLSLLNYFDQWCDLTKFSNDFLTHVWDISQATGFGLDIWGRILGQSRYIQITPSPNNDFGFNINGATGTQWKPWSQAPFYGGQAAGTAAFPLADTYYRKLLLVKAAANIAKTNAPSINALMRSMFGDRGRCYVGEDPARPMHVGYHFEFFPTPVEKSIIEYGLFPRPAATTVYYVYQTLTFTPFGFREMNRGADPAVVKGWSVPGSPFYSPGSPSGQMLNNIGGTFILDQSQMG